MPRNTISSDTLQPIPRYSEYYICFFDLLGQKQLFMGINSTSPKPEIMDHVNRVSDGLREIVHYAQNRYRRYFADKDHAGIEMFSDSILFFMEAQPEEHAKLCQWLGILVKIIYIACNRELPFRGSIVHGHAALSKSGTIYGKAVDDAIRLEAVYSDYPRIILGNVLKAEFSSGDALKKFFMRDSDSIFILDYAGKELLELDKFRKEKANLNKIYEWVRTCHDQFRFNGDANHDRIASSKLARRYLMWLLYLFRKVREVKANV